jgi:hypothetical protein
MTGWMAADTSGANGMVVVGFGRTHENGVHPHLCGPHRFRVRFVESVRGDTIVSATQATGEK